MSYIEFRDIEKYFGNNHVLKKTNLTIQKGEFVTLLGASGCGKSTLLRCFAGLEKVSSGRIYLDGQDITDVNPRERNVGMIFQQYSLFPNLTVYKNIAFGLKMKKMNKEEIHSRVINAIEMVDLKGKENNFPAQLSGGEQQRVALARSIVTRPKVLLLDEPLSAIDAKLRKALQSRIKEIHQELEMTSIFVTHDQDEAMTMSDTIHLMKDGVIEQSGNPFELYGNPKNSFAAGFIGNYNMLSHDEFSQIIGPESLNEYILFNDNAIRPELIEISDSKYLEIEKHHEFTGEVIKILPQGNIIRYTVKVRDFLFQVDVLNNSGSLFHVGQHVYLLVKKEDLIVL
ncbi:MAG: ABC transporter ATP-binding protein [Gudongella sp.]|jgi:putative spermidine/putrescine transport system ATP-binding protein|nr:ABC transporter ATP-binding protein [Gudongella sp.]